jgi:nucleotide-binding universal stress UspA family protein
MAVFERILVATDLSEASERALELAGALARESGAELHVVHVCEIPAYGDPTSSIDIVTPLMEIAKQKFGALMSSIRTSSPGAKDVLKMGNAWERILAAAEDVGADLIVLGTHGRRGFAHAILGSVAERVVRLSEIPVLTVTYRPAKHGETSA